MKKGGFSLGCERVEPKSPRLTSPDAQSPGTDRTSLSRGLQAEPASSHSTDNQTVTATTTSATENHRCLPGSAGPRLAQARPSPGDPRPSAAGASTLPCQGKLGGTHLSARRASADPAAVPALSAAGVSEPGGSGGSESTPPEPVAAALPGGRTLGRTVRRARRNMAVARERRAPAPTPASSAASAARGGSPVMPRARPAHGVPPRRRAS